MKKSEDYGIKIFCGMCGQKMQVKEEQKLGYYSDTGAPRMVLILVCPKWRWWKSLAHSKTKFTDSSGSWRPILTDAGD